MDFIDKENCYEDCDFEHPESWLTWVGRGAAAAGHYNSNERHNEEEPETNQEI